MRYVERGAGRQTVVLLHDLAESCLVWETLADFLDDMGFRVVAPDLRGARGLPMPCVCCTQVIAVQLEQRHPDAWGSFQHHTGCAGHGGSSRSYDASYSLASLCRDLHSLVLEMGLYAAPFALAGAGLGAAVALRFAASHPQLVGALALVSYHPAMPLPVFHSAQAAEFTGVHTGLQWVNASCQSIAQRAVAASRGSPLPPPSCTQPCRHAV